MQPLAPEVLQGWDRLGAIGLALPLTDSDPLAGSLERSAPAGPELGGVGWPKDVSTSQSCSWLGGGDWSSAASDLRIAPAILPRILASHGFWRSRRAPRCG